MFVSSQLYYDADSRFSSDKGRVQCADQQVRLSALHLT